MGDENSDNVKVSIIVPTYNESQNIIQVLKSIEENLPKNTLTESIIVDDNSPDGTGRLVEDYIKKAKQLVNYSIRIVHRKTKSGLGSAILEGIKHANGDSIVIMDSDFSHPPKIIPKMINELKNSQCDIIIASRYMKGGSIDGWTLKRKLISKFATNIAKKGLGVKETDPMSGFFAFKRNILQGLKLDAIGYKLLLEVLVKTKGVHVKEIPYSFSNRDVGSSKLDSSTILDYIKSVWRLYRYGKSIQQTEKQTSIHFVSKAARFYTVGASGLLVNYLVSFLFADIILDFWYLQANIVGIMISMISNFILNKIWTFEDMDFSRNKTLIQLGKFIGFSSIGGLIQIGMVYGLVEEHQIIYPVALILAVLIAAIGNFIFNKRFTFKEKIWS